METVLRQQTTIQEPHIPNLTIMPLRPPDRTYEEMTLEIDLNTIKGSPLDQESVPSITTDDDSQHSLIIASNHEDAAGTQSSQKTSIIVEAPSSSLIKIEKESDFSNGSQNNQRGTKNTYICEVCKKVFYKPSRLLSHMTVHSDEKDFICSLCNKGFKSRSQLQRHSNTHSAVPNFCCNICGRGFKHNDVAKHIRRFHSGPRRSRRGGTANPDTSVSPSHNSFLQVVQNSHESVSQCPDSLAQPSDEMQSQQSVIIQNHSAQQDLVHLEHDGVLSEDSEIIHHPTDEAEMYHIDSMSGSSNDSTPVCPTPLSTYHCTQCNMSLPSPSALASHMTSHPKPDQETGNSPKKDKKKHQCHLCDKTFTRAFGLSGHLLLHSRTEKRREPNPDFRCPVCGKIFIRRAGLNAHVLQHEGVPRFWCDEPECGKGFVHSYQLIRHKRIHSDVLPYTCHVCEKSFRHNDLPKHMRTHTGEKPYNCQHCGKAFAFSSSLRTHERMHLALKENLCEICNMGFTTTAGLRRHAKCHEDEREELCSSCGKFFPSKLHLTLHMRESHHCAQQQLPQIPQDDQMQHLQQVHIQPTQHLQVMPVSHVQHQVQQVQQLSQIPMHELQVDVQQPSIPIHMSQQTDSQQLLHQSDSSTLATLAASNPDPMVSEESSQTTSSAESLPVLVPFSVSVPISVPFGINPDQIPLNHFLNWEQKY